MSNVETKHIPIGPEVHVETMPDGTPLGRPVRFSMGTTGWYLDVEGAESIGKQLLEAARLTRELKSAP